MKKIEEKISYAELQSKLIESNFNRIELQSRIEKATEYIKTLRERYFRMRVAGSNNDLSELIEILDGEDKDIEKGIKSFKEYWEEVNTVGCDLYEAKLEYFDRLSKITIELIDEVNKLKNK